MRNSNIGEYNVRMEKGKLKKWVDKCLHVLGKCAEVCKGRFLNANDKFMYKL